MGYLNTVWFWMLILSIIVFIIAVYFFETNGQLSRNSDNTSWGIWVLFGLAVFLLIGAFVFFIIWYRREQRLLACCTPDPCDPCAPVCEPEPVCEPACPPPPCEPVCPPKCPPPVCPPKCPPRCPPKCPPRHVSVAQVATTYVSPTSAYVTTAPAATATYASNEQFQVQSQSQSQNQYQVNPMTTLVSTNAM